MKKILFAVAICLSIPLSGFADSSGSTGYDANPATTGVIEKIYVYEMDKNSAASGGGGLQGSIIGGMIEAGRTGDLTKTVGGAVVGGILGGIADVVANSVGGNKAMSIRVEMDDGKYRTFRQLAGEFAVGDHVQTIDGKTVIRILSSKTSPTISDSQKAMPFGIE